MQLLVCTEHMAQQPLGTVLEAEQPAQVTAAEHKTALAVHIQRCAQKSAWLYRVTSWPEPGPLCISNVRRRSGLHQPDGVWAQLLVLLRIQKSWCRIGHVPDLHVAQMYRPSSSYLSYR